MPESGETSRHALSREQKDILHRKNQSRIKNRHRDVVRYAKLLGDEFFHDGQFDRAREEYCEAVEILRQWFPEDRLEAARLLRLIGDAFDAAGQLSRAKASYSEYLTLAKVEGDRVEMQRAYTLMGKVHLDSVMRQMDELEEGEKPNQEMLNSVKRADVYCVQGLEEIVAIDLDSVTAKEKLQMEIGLLRNRAEIAFIIGDHEKGETLLDRARLICERSGDLHDELARVVLRKLTLAVDDRREGKIILDLCATGVLAAEKAKDSHLLIEILAVRMKAYLTARRVEEAYRTVQRIKGLKGSQKALGDSSIGEIYNGIRKVRYLFRKLAQDQSKSERVKCLEKIADELSSLKSFEASNWYYAKCIEIAEGVPGKRNRIAALVSSIAINHFDSKNYEEAKAFFQKELEMRRPGSKERTVTFDFLADCEMQSDAPYSSAMKHLDQALHEVVGINNPRREKSLLERVIMVQKRYEMHGELQETLDRLAKLEEKYPPESDVWNEGDSASEDDDADGDDGPDSDVKFSSDEDEAKENRPGRAKRSTVKITKNAHGEARLQQLCKTEGNIDKIRDLIAKGHPVNLECNTGFTALHEAAANGEVEYVAALLDAGAKVNAVQKEGCTPLMSACGNGHAEVIQLLLDRKAKPTSQDSWGWNSFDHLKKFYSDAKKRSPESLTAESERFAAIKRILKSMMETLENMKASGSDPYPVPRQDKSFLFGESEDSQELLQPRPSTQRESKREARNSRRDAILRDSSVFDSRGEDEDEVKNYASVMSQFKSQKRSRERVVSEVRPRRAEPLKRDKMAGAFAVDDEEADREWLEDDIGEAARERANLKRTSVKVTSPQKKRKRLQQPRLDSVLAPRAPSINDEADENSGESPELDVPATTTTLQEDNVLAPTPVVRAPSAVQVICSKVKVRFDSGEVLWLPVSQAEAFADLCARASDRFAEIHGKRPVIALKSTDGASFHSSDLVSAMVSDNQELLAVIVKWDVRPIDERYRDECSHRSAKCFKNIEAALLESQLSNKFRLNCSLTSQNSVPLLKALIFEDRLTELNLARNSLDKSCVQALCESLPTLKCLKTLNLSNTGLTSESLQPFEDLLAKGQGSCFAGMTSVNLNFNLFGDTGAKFTRALLKEAEALEELSLRSCGLSPMFFLQSPDAWRPVLVGLTKLKRFDLSYNPKMNKNVHTFLETNVIDQCSLKFSHK